MTDSLDIASELEQVARDEAIHAQRMRKGIATKTVADSALFCTNEECGLPIPLKRRQAMPGCQLCISCQTRKERYS